MAVLQDFKCPCCGASVKFDPTAQKMKCPYCDTEYETETLREMDGGSETEKPDEMNWNSGEAASFTESESDGMSVYVCDACGGEIIGDPTTAATSCPYCGNPVVIRGKVAGELRPDLVIPFKLDKKAAKEGFMNHLKGKKLLPAVFKTENHIDEIKGVYVPYWLYSSDADTHIKYKGSKVRRWSDRKYDYTETSFYALFRSGSLGFDNIPADGSKKMADSLTESIEPYDLSQAVDFQTAYLSGYFADKYDVTADEASPRVNERAKKTVEKEFSSTTVGYLGVIAESSSIKLINGSVKYALLPVWLLNTTWKGKSYRFAMNGQTGKFIGNLPVDRGAYWKWWAVYSGCIAAGIFALIALLTLL